MFSSEDDDRREFLKICGKSVAVTDHYPVALELAHVKRDPLRLAARV